jgi:cysteine desulfurase
MIYLDNGATTRPLPNPYNIWLNSHSSYSNGDYILWNCRERIAKCINCEPSEIYFTSGGCEGNTWCINILYDILKRPVLVSPNEHKSIMNNPRIIIGHNELDSCMLINNETGVRYDCESIHKDLVQALGKVKVDVKELGCKMAIFSGHKVHGDKGVGFVYISEDIDVKPLIYGGGQERGVRGGTSNVRGVLGMCDGVELVCGDEHMEKNKVLYDYFINRLIKYNLEYDVCLLSNAEPSIPTFSLRNTKYINGEYIVNRLAEKKIYISTGSACSTGEPSYVLKNLGLTDDEANATIRVSLDGEENTKEDIDIFFEEIGGILND